MSDTGRLTAICVSEHTGTVKHPVPEARIRAGHGIVGDAHAGPGHRQVSALAAESVDRMRVRLPDLADGAFGENLLTEGFDWDAVVLGQRLRVGDDVVLQVTQRGKVCHSRCAIYDATGECIMPTEGMFFVARAGGAIRVGDTVRVDAELDRIRYAVLTVSDRSAAGLREDRSGPAVDEALAAGDLPVVRVDARVVPDVRERIAEALRELCDEDVVDLVFTSGGTGLAPRDVTPEATADVCDRLVPGMAEAIRAEGLRHTPHAMLSRAVCGQRGRTLILNLSGSPRAVREQVAAVLPALAHAVETVSGVPQDCARP